MDSVLLVLTCCMVLVLPTAFLDIGSPQGDVPLVMLSFNIGVEMGQLALFAPAFKKSITSPNSVALITTAYAIGGVSAYWLFDRLSGF